MLIAKKRPDGKNNIKYKELLEGSEQFEKLYKCIQATCSAGYVVHFS